MPAKHPKFQRPNLRNKRVKDTWRKPHGIDSKQRQKLRWAGDVPNKGYRGEKVKRDIHPTGKFEIFVRNLKELEAVKAKGVAIRMQGTLSKKSKEIIRKKAEVMGLSVLN